MYVFYIQLIFGELMSKLSGQKTIIQNIHYGCNLGFRALCNGLEKKDGKIV